MTHNRSSGFRGEIFSVVSLIVVMWIVFLIDRIAPLELLGLVPRTMSGLFGIATMPVLHKDVAHIMSNTVPLAVLGVILIGAAGRAALVIASVWILSGALLWVFGRSALHIGASGVVFGLVTFLIVSGFVERRIINVAISIGVGFFYGGMLLPGVLPLQAGVSWDGHLAGAIAGVLTAFMTRTRRKPNAWG